MTHTNKNLTSEKSHQPDCEYIKHVAWHEENNQHLCNCPAQIPSQNEVQKTVNRLKNEIDQNAELSNNSPLFHSTPNTINSLTGNFPVTCGLCGLSGVNLVAHTCDPEGLKKREEHILKGEKECTYSHNCPIHGYKSCPDPQVSNEWESLRRKVEKVLWEHYNDGGYAMNGEQASEETEIGELEIINIDNMNNEITKEFPEGKENYCPRCYFEDEKIILKKDCPHLSLLTKE